MANGLSVFQVFEMFPDEATAEAWFVAQRWPDGVRCVECHSDDVQVRESRKPQPFRCRACRKDFSAKTGSVMHASKLPIRTWVLAMWLLSDRCKGTSSHQLARDLGVTQKTAWFLAHRIREAWADTYSTDRFDGPVEVDETYIGGVAKNMHATKRKHLTGRGGVDKTPVVGIKDRATGKVTAQVVAHVSARTLVPYITERTHADTVVFTDGHYAYQRLPRPHAAVQHTVGEYVRGMAHTNGIESFWAMLKRGYQGTYHQMSAKHLDRYVTEFSARHNQRDHAPTTRLGALAAGCAGKRLDWATLTAQ